MKGLIAATLLGLAAIAFIPVSGRLASWSTHGPLLVLLVVISAVALWARRWDAIHLALVATFYLGAYCLPVVGALWPLPLAVVLVLYGALLAAVPAARRSVRFWHRGMLDRGTLRLIGAFTLLAAIALVTWRYASHADLGGYRKFVPAGVPRAAIFAGILPYAMFNAAFEELVWRGVVWQACAVAFGTGGALLLSTLSFGLAHYRGFPSGVVGVVLASIYSLMMGVVRIRTRGLFFPWLAHVCADIVIFSMVALMVVSG